MVTTVQAGRLMVGIAALGLLVSVIGAVVAWQLIGDLDRGMGRSLELTGEVLVTVDESFVIADESLAILTDGVAQAEEAVRSLSSSMRAGQSALESATELTGGEVADTLEIVERSLPAMEAAADAIDETLAALSALPFGLAYSPDRPLGESIAQVREGLEGLPDDLREQAVQVQRTTEELTASAAGAAATADALAELETRLAAAARLVREYTLRTGEAQELVREQREVIAASTSRARIMVLVAAIVFAASQFVPFHLGTGLLRGRADAEVV